MKIKNKKGFTLIELLAVIVVLAIIALIATPIVMNTIKNAKKGAAERTADNYIKQIETTIAEKKLENNPLTDGPYTIDENGNLTGNGLTESVTIDMSGTKPSGGTVKISNGLVSKEETTMTVGDYDVKYNQENNKYEATEKGNTSSTTVVYRWSTDEIKIGATIDTNNTSKFTKDASTLGKSYYLKHVLDKDNKVTESYACAIFGGTEYCVRGGKDNDGNSFYGYAENSSDYTGNALILKQIKDAKIEGISCSFNANNSHCNDAAVDLNAISNAEVNAHVADGYCNVTAGGSSYCEI